MAAARPLALPLALLALLAAPAAADCRDPAFHWSETRPAVNVRHIFCGELDDGRPKGLHSAQLLATSPLVDGIVRRREEGGGVYSALVRFQGGREKLSTFFPDGCSVDAVVHSIAYAARHPSGRHPAWGEVGPSAPGAGAAGYCLDDGGQPILIRFGRRRDGRINTAFPVGEGR